MECGVHGHEQGSDHRPADAHVHCAGGCTWDHKSANNVLLQPQRMISLWAKQVRVVWLVWTDSNVFNEQILSGIFILFLYSIFINHILFIYTLIFLSVT